MKAEWLPLVTRQVTFPAPSSVCFGIRPLDRGCSLTFS